MRFGQILYCRLIRTGWDKDSIRSRAPREYQIVLASRNSGPFVGDRVVMCPSAVGEQPGKLLSLLRGALSASSSSLTLSALVTWLFSLIREDEGLSSTSATGFLATAFRIDAGRVTGPVGDNGPRTAYSLITSRRQPERSVCHRTSHSAARKAVTLP